MLDTYSALGEVLAAAYANGDDLEGGIDPDEQADGRRGLQLEHKGYSINVLANPDEPRFRADLALLFSSRLRDDYTPADIERRADVDFGDLSPEERERAIGVVVEDDLRRLDEQYDEFVDGIEDVEPIGPRVFHVSKGDGDLWNGVLLSEYFTPYDGLSRTDYAETVDSLTAAADRLRPLVSEVFDEALDRENGSKIGQATTSTTQYRGFQ